MGATALDLAMVAAGVGVGSVAHDPRVWDLAAGALLVQEAGGVVLSLGLASHVPLVAGTDYADDGRPALSGPTQPWLAELVTRVGIQPAS